MTHDEQFLEFSFLTHCSLSSIDIKLQSVIHPEIGISESRDSHNQKHVSPSDKRVSFIHYFSLFPVQNALLRSWNDRTFVTTQFHGN